MCSDKRGHAEYAVVREESRKALMYMVKQYIKILKAFIFLLRYLLRHVYHIDSIVKTWVIVVDISDVNDDCSRAISPGKVIIMTLLKHKHM